MPSRPSRSTRKPSALARLRKLCLALPDAHEKISWGEPTWRAGSTSGKIFAMYAASSNHHGDGRESVWLKSTPTNQEFVLRANPTRYFKPPYVGPSGWVGVFLDGRVNWRELASLIEDAHTLAQPPKKKRR